MTTLRLLVVDDHPVVRDGLRAALVAVDDVEVVGEAGTVAEAVRRTVELAPDVVLMDVQLPDGTGVEATARLLRARPGTGVVMMTMHGDEDTVRAALSAGARGYLLKGAAGDDVVAAVRAVARGQAVLGTGVAEAALARLAAPAPPRAVFPALTAREHELVDQVASGATNAEAAAALGVSEKTVRNQLSGVLVKLGVRDRAALIVRAREAGLGTSRR
jgi:DNA-binding NarL/FixJ family response regulator